MRQKTEQNETQVQSQSPGDAQWLHLVYRSIYRLQLQSCWTDMKKDDENLHLKSPRSLFISLLPQSSWHRKVWRKETPDGVKQPRTFLPSPLCSPAANSFSMMDRLSQSNASGSRGIDLSKYSMAFLSQSPQKDAWGWMLTADSFSALQIFINHINEIFKKSLSFTSQ